MALGFWFNWPFFNGSGFIDGPLEDPAVPADPVDEDGEPGVDPRVLGLAAAYPEADDTDLGPLATDIL